MECAKGAGTKYYLREPAHFYHPHLLNKVKAFLQFAAQLSSVIVIVGSLIRALISRPFGKFADKYSFTNMLIICMIIEAIAFLAMTFATPVLHTEFLYWVYYIFYCIGMAGINSATINLYFDYVDKDKRTGALAIKTSAAGLLGFVATLIASPIVTAIQENNNQVFGMTIYAQQLLSLVSSVLVIGIILYLVFVVKKADKAKDE